MKKPFVFPGRNPYHNDPDETEGRRIYRGRANAEAAFQMALCTRRIKIKEEDE